MDVNFDFEGEVKEVENQIKNLYKSKTMIKIVCCCIVTVILCSSLIVYITSSSSFLFWINIVIICIMAYNFIRNVMMYKLLTSKIKEFENQCKVFRQIRNLTGS